MYGFAMWRHQGVSGGHGSRTGAGLGCEAHRDIDINSQESQPRSPESSPSRVAWRCYRNIFSCRYLKQFAKSIAVRLLIGSGEQLVRGTLWSELRSSSLAMTSWYLTRFPSPRLWVASLNALATYTCLLSVRPESEYYLHTSESAICDDGTIADDMTKYGHLRVQARQCCRLK